MGGTSDLVLCLSGRWGSVLVGEVFYKCDFRKTGSGTGGRNDPGLGVPRTEEDEGEGSSTHVRNDPPPSPTCPSCFRLSHPGGVGVCDTEVYRFGRDGLCHL